MVLIVECMDGGGVAVQLMPVAGESVVVLLGGLAYDAGDMSTGE